MRSMTGYGRVEQVTTVRRIAVELKSYNSRYLEVKVNVPPGYGALEPRLHTMVSERVARGRVELSLAIADLSNQVRVAADTDAARAYLAALRELADVAGGAPVTLSHLLAVGGFLHEQGEPCVEQAWSECRHPLAEVFAQFEATCDRDGAVTEADVRRLLTTVEREVDRIEAAAPQAVQQMHEAVAERAQALLAHGVDEGRLAAALAVVLVKSDVNEELIRLRGHVGAFRTALDGGERAKKLEFICQEMMREANTVAAKGAAYSISAAAVRVKDAIERIREHLRNVV